MSKNSRHALIGAVSGLGLAAAILLLNWLNQRIGDIEALQNVVNFLASIPVFYLFWNIPSFFQYILFFVYWIFIGGIFGWLMAQSYPWSKVVLLILCITLITSHRLTQVKIEKDLSAAMEGFGQALRSLFVPAEPSTPIDSQEVTP